MRPSKTGINFNVNIFQEMALILKINEISVKNTLRNTYT
jgi:DNA-binding CsgD family transcriptional regulator